MNHGLMAGMFWGGVLLSAFPVLLGIGIFVYILRGRRVERRRAHGPGSQHRVGAKP